MMKKAAIEKIKNAVIALLLIITLVLSALSVYMLLPNSSIAGTLSYSSTSSQDGTNNLSSGAGAEAARPFCVVVTDENGNHYGVKYSDSGVNETYTILSGAFGESIGSAQQTPKSVSEETWRDALLSQGAYLEYNDAVPLNVLAGWFGGETQTKWNGFSVKRLCITVSGSDVYLYFMDSNDGDFYYTKTAASADSLITRIGTFRANDAYFAFENENQIGMYPYMVLCREAEPQSISVSNPLKSTENVDAVVTALGANPRLTPNYPGNNKSVIYVERDFTIKVNSDGSVVYRLAENSEKQNGENVDSVIVEAARENAANVMELFADDAQVQFAGIEQDGEGTATVYFDYFVEGCRIYVGQNGHGCEAVFENGQLTQMTLYFRTYTLSGSQTQLLLEVQASAAAGGYAKIGYSDSGADVIFPQWFVAQE